MIRWGLVIGVSALCLSGAPASAGPLEIYQLLGVSPGSVGEDGEAFGSATAAALDDLVGGTWSADEKPRVGFYGGLGLRYRHNDLLSFATEVDFAVRGARWELDELGSGLTLTQTLALNYVEIPLLVQVTPAAGGVVRPTFYAGPYLGLLAHSEISIGVPPDPSLSEVTSLDLDDVANGSYVGGIVGAGAEFQTTQTTALLAHIRYSTAFGNVVKDEIGYEFKPQGFALLLGVALKL